MEDVPAVTLHCQLISAKEYFPLISVKFQVLIPIISDAPKVLKQREMNEKLKPYYF